MQDKSKIRYNQTKKRMEQEKGKQGQEQILYFKNNTEQDKIQIIQIIRKTKSQGTIIILLLYKAQ